MKNAERYHFSDFTRSNYRRLLGLAQESYVFRLFTDFSRDERFVLWRHDVDFSVHAALKFAQIEEQEGVRSTYFLLLHSRFYNLLEREIARSARELARLGHRIGLHFDCEFDGVLRPESLAPRLLREKEILQDLVEQEIHVFSFHNPTDLALSWQDWEYSGLINTYARYFRNDVGYCSDSNGYWRHARLEEVLNRAEDARLQVLTHPEMWTETEMSPRERVCRCIEGRAANAKQWYEAFLKEHGRENIDW
ncbi:MAG: hypothetical protein HYU36_01525 [Planctomycetes bacterium]|nr:hypothetical protein [Planctomycetota bacterium]